MGCSVVDVVAVVAIVGVAAIVTNHKHTTCTINWHMRKPRITKTEIYQHPN